MTRTIWSFLAHFSFGMLTVFATTPINLIMFLTFIIYELDEDWHIKDGAWIDIAQYGIGLGIGAFLKIIMFLSIL